MRWEETTEKKIVKTAVENYQHYWCLCYTILYISISLMFVTHFLRNMICYMRKKWRRCWIKTKNKMEDKEKIIKVLKKYNEKWYKKMSLLHEQKMTITTTTRKKWMKKIIQPSKSWTLKIFFIYSYYVCRKINNNSWRVEAKVKRIP